MPNKWTEARQAKEAQEQGHQQNAMNVILKSTPPGLMDFDEAAFAKAQADRRATEAANRPPQDHAETLRSEYDDLSRRTGNGKAMSEADCKRHADEQAIKHAGIIQKITDEIHYVTSLLDSPGTDKCVGIRENRKESDSVANGCGCTAHVFRRKIRALEIQLRRAKNESDKSHRVCQGMIRDAAEVDKLRPRFAELEKMFRKIDTARKVARGIQNTDLQPEPMGGFGFTSRHIKWEGNTPHQK